MLPPSWLFYDFIRLLEIVFPLHVWGMANVGNLDQYCPRNQLGGLAAKFRVTQCPNFHF